MPHLLITACRHGGRLYGFPGFCKAKTQAKKWHGCYFLAAPRTALAKARAQSLNLGAFFVLRALLRLKPKRGSVIMGHHWR
jgi:hypothetical protein